MTNPAYVATNSDVEKLIALIKASREEESIPILLGHQFDQLIAALESANALNKHLKLAIRKAEGCSEALRRRAEVAENRIAELEAAPNGMMQLSNEQAEMKRKCAELEVQLDELAAQEPVAYITERDLKLLKNALHDRFVKHKPIMVRPIPLFTRAAPLTVKQPTPATPFDAAAAIRACMDEFPLAVQDIVEECAVIAENTIRAAGATIEGSE